MSDVRRVRVGDRVIAPFISACGACVECAQGEHQVCENQTQPGFHHWGSFAEFVAIDHADLNIVALPEGLDFPTAASLGCRFATSYRAVIQVGRVQAGEWVVVHGCGGIGLSAVMIAAAAGARVIGVDVNEEALELARAVGAEHAVPAGTDVRELTGRRRQRQLRRPRPRSHLPRRDRRPAPPRPLRPDRHHPHPAGRSRCTA